MAYQNFKDRSPYICAAGRPSGEHNDIAKLLKNYPLDDIVNALKHEANIPDKKPFKYKLPPLVNSRNTGVFTEIKGILGAPVKTRFQTLVNDLKETHYKTYWTAGDGKTKDPVGNLPLHVDPYVTTFGKPSEKGATVKELVNPDKSYGQVLEEYIKGHELYRKTHNDYYPNERINRKYLKPAFSSERMYGERNGYDQRGTMMKCCTKGDSKDHFTVVNTVLAEYQKKTVPKVGQPLAPNNNINCVPKGHPFGRPSIKEDSVAELCSENPRPQIQNDIEIFLSFINPLRAFLKRRYNQNLFSYTKFLDALKYRDKEKTGWIPLATLHEMCGCFKLYYDRIEIEEFLTLFGIIKGDQINYSKFVDVLNWQTNFMEITDCYHVTPKVQYYKTTNRAAREDYKYIDNTGHRPAGLASLRLDQSYPNVPEGGCRADLESLGSETDAHTIMYPSVYTSYGLSHYDFFVPREKHQIRKIFTNIGYKIDDDMFEKIWNEGVQLDKTGLVCPETFKNLVKKYNIEYIKEPKK